MVQHIYGFSRTEEKLCHTCKEAIKYSDITSGNAFYHFIRKTHHCAECFSEQSPILANYPILPICNLDISKVYIGWDEEQHAPLLLRESPNESKEMIERGRRAINTCRDFESSHLLQVVDWKNLNGKHYLVKKYQPGLYLKQIMKHCKKTFPLQVTLELLIQICKALKALHEHQLVYRAITPDEYIYRLSR